jgi:hypothetical protein
VRLDQRPSSKSATVLRGMIADEAVPVQGAKGTKSAHEPSQNWPTDFEIGKAGGPRIERGRLERPLALRLLRLFLCLPLFTHLLLFVFGKLWRPPHERDGDECNDERRGTDCCWYVFHASSFPIDAHNR